MKIIARIITVSFYVAVCSAIWGAFSRFGFSPAGVGLAALVCLIAALIAGVLVELEKMTSKAKKDKEDAGL